MTTNEILNTKNLPKTNSQIRKASPKKIAIAIADAFLHRDIYNMGRDFDNLWENGRTEKIVKEFTKIWCDNPALREVCVSSEFFSPNMLGINEEQINK